MARWRQLPQDLDPLVVQLVVELRRIKDDSGLSQAQFAGRTGYSASSWDRYLNGRSLPPRAALEAVAEALRADQAHLLALHEMAEESVRRTSSAAEEVQDEEQESGPAQGTASPAPQPGTGPEADASAVAAGVTAAARSRTPIGGMWGRFATAAISALAGAALMWFAIQPAQATPACPPAKTAVVSGRTLFKCAFVHKDGLWYAGNSATSTRNLVVDMSGPDVAELQCLLQRIGDTPGGIDGNFGPLTEAAVIAAQKALHLDVDGQVGPKTWAALRG